MESDVNARRTIHSDDQGVAQLPKQERDQGQNIQGVLAAHWSVKFRLVGLWIADAIH
jgi:hypothetical protein